MLLMEGPVESAHQTCTQLSWGPGLVLGAGDTELTEQREAGRASTGW